MKAERKNKTNKITTMDEKEKAWLIGFTEAEGSFSIAKRGDLSFVITQGYRNLAVLYNIRELIGFGSVNKQGPRTFRYVVQDAEGLGEVIKMLNGRLVLNKRILGEKGLGRFIAAYNERYSGSLVLNETRAIPTRADG